MKPIALCVVLLAACGGNDKDSASGTVEDCAEVCRNSSGGAPTNDCLAVDGAEACVYTCSSDDDCLEPFYTGCSASSDDGTAICESEPSGT